MHLLTVNQLLWTDQQVYRMIGNAFPLEETVLSMRLLRSGYLRMEVFCAQKKNMQSLQMEKYPCRRLRKRRIATITSLLFCTAILIVALYC